MYGGNKTEMQRLIKDAAKMTDIQKELGITVDASSMSFGNIVNAISVVQKQMGIAGTTTKEAEGTITGSLNSVKGAWGNLLVAMASGDDMDGYIKDMTDTLEVFLGNMIPIAQKALAGIGRLIEKLAPIIAEKLPSLARDLIPPLIKAAVELTKGLIKALPSIIKTLAVSIVDIFGEQFPIIAKIGNFFKDNAGKIASGIKMLIPIIIALVAAFKGFKAIKSITSLFGGKSKGGAGGEKDGLMGGITNTFKDLAKAKTTTILKGMANLAIIIGGMTLITAALGLIAPSMGTLIGGDFVKLVASIAALGLVGAALAKMGQITGNIPVTTVVKGLANMAIMIAGMSALFLLVGAVSLIKFDLKRVLGIALLIGVLGTVGAALSVFAGIVGLIPIPVVLMGLANMALVLGGVTALIVAFGALSQIKGLTEFIDSGGKLLVKIFGIIGEVVGAVIGGVAKGITNSLPAIGENLSKFAQSLKPMFETFAGADMSGIGSFFTAIGTFMLQMGGNKILEFFTGKTDFSGVANGLNTLSGQGTKNFLNMVSQYEQATFDKAASFFKALDGISSLPNAGGIGQLFTGKNDFSGVAKGLGTLASGGVKNFFAMVSGFETVAFDNAKLFFKSLDGISSLPNAGGLGQLFSGKNDFSGVAKGLEKLSGDGVKNFFAMVSGLDNSVFSKTKELFNALADISKVGQKGFWESVGDAFTGGEKESGIAKIARELSEFTKNTQSFFTTLQNLDLAKLNGMWDSLSRASGLSVDITNAVSLEIGNIVSMISELPNKMGEALKGSSSSLSDAMVEMWKDAIKASVSPVNKLLSGANHILKEFGSKKRVIDWQPYARGTDGHKGGNALVNDGRGAELVQMPNGNTFIPNGRNVFLPNAPKGMKVLSAERTAKLFGKSSPSFRYANGIGNIDVWEYFDNAEGLVSKITEGISYNGLNGLRRNMSEGMVTTFAGEMSAWVDNLFDNFGGKSIDSYVASKGVWQWRSTVAQALKMEGLYSVGNVLRTLFQMATESGGNPLAINKWDSNAKKGTPSKGLMQVIDPTFNAYARSGFNKNIYDPLSNILASIRYATSRYGSLSKAYRGVGYSKGVGTVSIPQPNSINLSYTPESSYTGGRAEVTEHNTYSPVFNFTISGTGDDRTMARKVKRWVVEAMNEMFDDLEAKTPQTQQV